MPDGRTFPYKYFPKMGIKLGVAFDDPIPAERITTALGVLRRDRGASPHTNLAGGHGHDMRRSGPLSRPGLGDELSLGGWVGDAAAHAGEDLAADFEAAARKRQMDEVRSEVTAIIQRAVEDLGRKVSGDKLDRPLAPLDLDQR